MLTEIVKQLGQHAGVVGVLMGTIILFQSITIIVLWRDNKFMRETLFTIIGEKAALAAKIESTMTNLKDVIMALINNAKSGGSQ